MATPLEGATPLLTTKYRLPTLGSQRLPRPRLFARLDELFAPGMRLALMGRRFDDLDQLTEALNDALDCWNRHCHPYSWKKCPQEQAAILGGFGVQIRSDNPAL